jgi:hypothetical protein
MRAFEIDLHVTEKAAGWMLLCFEDDDCIWEEFFRDRSKAEAQGNKYLDGTFIQGFVAA